MDNRTEKLMKGSEAIVADTWCLTFLKESETAVREVARSKGRSYKSILSALNDGMAIKDLRQAFSRARKSAMGRYEYPKSERENPFGYNQSGEGGCQQEDY